MAKKSQNQKFDTAYLLKIVLYLIIGSQWLKIITKGGLQIPIPVGAIIAVIFAAHDHFQIDRKIEYAVILVAMFIGFWIPLGAVLQLH
jgi:hypothetical protein